MIRFSRLSMGNNLYFWIVVVTVCILFTALSIFSINLLVLLNDGILLSCTWNLYGCSIQHHVQHFPEAHPNFPNDFQLNMHREIIENIELDEKQCDKMLLKTCNCAFTFAFTVHISQ